SADLIPIHAIVKVTTPLCVLSVRQERLKQHQTSISGDQLCLELGALNRVHRATSFDFQHNLSTMSAVGSFVRKHAVG
ncbi:hypothetical protein BaRGS_00017395, partial [Batillaria attramentaria]